MVVSRHCAVVSLRKRDVNAVPTVAIAPKAAAKRGNTALGREEGSAVPLFMLYGVKRNLVVGGGYQ